ncbi:hypothetical protein FRC06_001856 [Ceratobasidium sp. 370]|nr:hypothetical protein FRC06_001856 [Ceratobasidium sp. 370]
MRFTAISVVLGLVLMVSGCTLPDTWDRSAAYTVYSAASHRNASMKTILAIFETAWIESHANNLNCSDRGTSGIFQRRCRPASLCLDVKHETNAFINRAVRVARPSMTPGQLAQAVHGGDARRYDAAEPMAKAILASILWRLSGWIG